MKSRKRFLFIVLMSLGICLGNIGVAMAAPRQNIDIRLTPSGFIPKAVVVKANQRLKINFSNETKKVAEFESYDMKFEKIAVPNGKVSVFTGALKPGTYRFFDDYKDGVLGRVIVKKSAE